MLAQSCPALCDPMDYIALQALMSFEFSRQKYQSGLPFPSSGDFPNPGIEPIPPSLQVVSCIAGGFSTTDASGNGGSLKIYKQRYHMIQ